MGSITDTPGQWWQLKEIEFYTSKDGSGDKVAPSKAMASTFKGDINESENKAEKAIDGDASTFWSTSDKYKFEWIGVEFDAPQTIGSIKMQLTDPMMGPAMVIVEKSFDGEWWSRSTEFADMKEWGSEMQLYSLIQMDQVPKSFFALRSQENPRFCVGVRARPHPTDDKADPLPLTEDAMLEVQICDDNTVTQYWTTDDETQPPLLRAVTRRWLNSSCYPCSSWKRKNKQLHVPLTVMTTLSQHLLTAELLRKKSVPRITSAWRTIGLMTLQKAH